MWSRAVEVLLALSHNHSSTFDLPATNGGLLFRVPVHSPIELTVCGLTVKLVLGKRETVRACFKFMKRDDLLSGRVDDVCSAYEAWEGEGCDSVEAGANGWDHYCN